MLNSQNCKMQSEKEGKDSLSLGAQKDLGHLFFWWKVMQTSIPRGLNASCKTQGFYHHSSFPSYLKLFQMLPSNIFSKCLLQHGEIMQRLIFSNLLWFVHLSMLDLCVDCLLPTALGGKAFLCTYVLRFLGINWGQGGLGFFLHFMQITSYISHKNLLNWTTLELLECLRAGFTPGLST